MGGSVPDRWRPALLVAGLLGCGGDPTEPTPSLDFECIDEAQHFWLRCAPGGDLEWCHSAYTPRPHFHLIRNCADFGFTCETLGLGEAACVLPGETCEGPAARCAEGRAENCRAGRWAVSPCPRRAPCTVVHDEAVCAG